MMLSEGRPGVDNLYSLHEGKEYCDSCPLFRCVLYNDERWIQRARISVFEISIRLGAGSTEALLASCISLVVVLFAAVSSSTSPLAVS